jgi:hypothetical protein
MDENQIPKINNILSEYLDLDTIINIQTIDIGYDDEVLLVEYPEEKLLLAAADVLYDDDYYSNLAIENGFKSIEKIKLKEENYKKYLSRYPDSDPYSRLYYDGVKMCQLYRVH